MNESDALNSYKELLIDMMIRAHGPLLHGDVLRVLLGYSSGGAMRSALSRDNIEVTLMEFPHRKGKFALSEDVSVWLVEQREKNNPGTPVGIERTILPSVDVNVWLKGYDLLLHEESIMGLLKLPSRKELLHLHKHDRLPFTVFPLDNRRSKLFALLPEVILYFANEDGFL